MNMGRILGAVLCMLLTGCLVTFKEPLPGQDKAPGYLLDHWIGQNEWGEIQHLVLTPHGENRYQAETYTGAPDNRNHAETFDFTVKRQGKRWYMSVLLPSHLGGDYAIGGFEITDQDDLVLYAIDVQNMRADLGHSLQGEEREIDDSEGLSISSAGQQVFEFLNDPIHADVFVEAMRFQRLPKAQQGH